MREIKFRLYNSWSSEMFYENDIDYTNAIKLHNSGTVELMQYTGLKDKNGKEIYEGDILERVTDVSVWKFKGVVEFQLTGAVGWRVKTNDGQWQLNSNDEYNIIGNIHENPELLNA